MGNIIKEEYIERTLNDFETFCRFVEERKPVLTKARSEIGKKDCFDLNMQMSFPKPFEEPKYLQIAYPSINLWFHISLKCGIFNLEISKGGSRMLVPTRRLGLFRQLNPYMRYIILFKVFWTMLDWDELYLETMDWLHHFLYIQIGFHALKGITAGERVFADVENFRTAYRADEPIHRMFVGCGIVIHHLQDFGFWQYERAYIKELISAERDINVKSITMSKLGTIMIKACLKVPLEIYNPHLKEERIRSSWGDSSVLPLLEKLNLNTPRPVVENGPLEDAFFECFPEGSIDKQIIEEFFETFSDINKDMNTYVFKVSLGRDCWRRIEASSTDTLKRLSEAINDAFGFWDDHLHSFFMDGNPWSKNVFWDKRDGGKPTTEGTVIGNLGLYKGQSFLYLYDFGDEWRIIVKVEDIRHDEAPPYKPVIFEEYGDNPELY